MISLKCKNCGGEMSVDLKGEVYCPYCGSKTHFSDAELKDYKALRSNMLSYLRNMADAKANKADETSLWMFQDSVTLFSKDDTEIRINYLCYSKEDGVECYVARENVVYVFDKSEVHRASAMTDGIGKLKYPSADMKGLSNYFPKMVSRIELSDGRLLVAYSKPENVYPLYAFGNMKAEHVAWIVSRLENFCCLFEYSEIVHGGLSLESVFINPKTHEAYLYGGWWKAHEKISDRDTKDLKDLRTVATKLIGEYFETSPVEFKKFLSGAPSEDAYTDFSKWDEVIEKGFGGHKFVKFTNN